MPFEWVPPRVFMRYRGIKIYHTYRNDVITDPSQYWFTFDGLDEDYAHSFDVRTLAYTIRGTDEASWQYPPDTEEMKEAMKTGIESGALLNCMPQEIAEEYYEKYGPFVHTLGSVPEGDENA